MAAMMTEFLELGSGDISTTVFMYGSILFLVVYTFIMVWISLR
jgi:hypothetical protein